MRRAVKVQPMKNYLLLVRFDNGEEKIFNCLPLLEDKIFSDLINLDYFATVHIDDMGLVCWDDSTDINPEVLYEDSENIENFKFAV